MDESVAEYLSAMVYPAANFEHPWAKAYDLDGKALTQPYAAYPLWQYYATKKGKNHLVPLMTTIASKPTREQRLAYLRSIGFDRLYHHFIFDFLEDNIKDPGGGAIPHEVVDSLRQDPFVLDADDPQPISLDTIPPERHSVFRIDVPTGYDITFYPPERSGKKVFFSLFDKGKRIKEWTETEKISGKCDGANIVYISATHLNEKAVTDITLNYDLSERKGCCGADVVISKNPSAENLDGDFTFDYHITSTLRVFSDKRKKSSPFNYYVNSKDGSILFSESFFFHDLDKEDFGGMEIKAVIWFPNAQLVAYVVDPLGVKRAMTIPMNQTAADIGLGHIFGATAFLKNAIGSRISPAPLPEGSAWRGKSSGYAYLLNDVSDPSKKGKISGYLSQEPSKTKTNLPFLGFMAGYMKDHENKPRQLVYSHYEQDGNIIEEHLKSMDRQCYSFSGSGYKKMTLFGDSGALGHMSEAAEKRYDASQEKIQQELTDTLAEMERCRDETCMAELTKRMIELQNKARGNLYDLPSNPLYSGTAGTDLNEKLKVLDDEATNLIKKVIDKEVECQKYEEALKACEKRRGSCKALRDSYRECKKEHEAIGKEMDKIQCQKAKLMGTEDLLYDCE